MELPEDEILRRLEELRLWKGQQDENKPLSEEQIELMQQLGVSFDQENFTEDGSVEDDQFFEDIERQIAALRSGETSMRAQNLDETPVPARKQMDFEATPLKSIDLNQIDVDDSSVSSKSLRFFFLK